MEILKEKNCRIIDGAENWQDAVRKAVRPLEEEGDVEPRYKEEIIKNVDTLGPYFVLAPRVAMPHARPEQGAIHTQIAVTLLKNPVVFKEGEEPVSLLIALAAADSTSHLDTLVTVAEVLSDEEKTNALLASKTPEELYRCFEEAKKESEKSETVGIA